MFGTEGSKGRLVAAAVLGLGGFALWLAWGAPDRPVRVASTAEPKLDVVGRDATAITDLVVPPDPGRETSDEPAAHSARGKALQVDVVDASGRPAAEVSIACGVVSSSCPEVFDALLRARSDARGTAWLDLSELPHPAGRSSDWPAESLRLRAEILAQPVPEIVLDRDVVEAKRVVLRLPPTGSVRLEAVDARGRPTRAAVRFAMWSRAEGARSDVESLPRWVVAPGGTAVLEHVGLGLELRVAVAVEDDTARAERILARGPQFSGEERTISVPLGQEWPTVLARAVDEHGNVLRNELLGIAVKWSEQGADPTWSPDAEKPRSLRTDGEGRVRFPLRGTVAGGYTRRLVLTRRAAGDDAAGVLRSAERDLSWDVAAGGEIDLGDVELRAVEQEDAVIWVSGVVVDPAGSLARSATVLVSAIDAEGTPLRGPTAKVDVEPDGSFVVTGPPVEQRFSVRAIAPGFLRSTEEVAVPGASGIHISLQPAARWAGRLRLDSDIPPGSLVVDVITPERRQRSILTSDRIAIDGLEEAWVDVEVRTRTGDWLVERWERMPTTPAGTPEARVDELDLRGRLTRLRLRLTEPDGTALDRVFARVHPAPWPEGGGWIRAGRLDLVVPSEARTIMVRPRGYPPVAAEVLGGLQELTCGA